MSLRLNREYYLGLVELWAKLGEIQMKEWGNESKCGRSCTRTCCRIKTTFRIAPLWPGDVEGIQNGLKSLKTEEVDKAIEYALEDKKTCPLWNRKEKLCTIYDDRPIMCRLYGFPIAFYDTKIAGDNKNGKGQPQPCCIENPLPGEKIMPHGTDTGLKIVELPMFQALSSVLQAGLSIGERMGTDFADLVRVLAQEELARR